MVFSNHASNQGNNRNDNSSSQNNKARKEGMSLLWTSTTIFPSGDKTNPAEAGFFLYRSADYDKLRLNPPSALLSMPLTVLLQPPEYWLYCMRTVTATLASSASHPAKLRNTLPFVSTDIVGVAAVPFV